MAVSCTAYHRIGGLYGKGRFAEAYELLQKEGPEGSKFQEYEFKLVLQLVLAGQKNYLPLLESLLKAPPPAGQENIYAFASAWVYFLSAQNPEGFKKTLELLPSAPMEDASLERVRIAVQNQALLRLGRFQEVLVNLDGKTGRNPDLIYLLASGYKGLGKGEEALTLYGETLKFSQDSLLKGLCHFHMGEIYEQNQKNKEAKEAYLKSWDLAADNASLNFKLGRLLAQDNYEALPQRFYRAALRIDENHAEAWYYLNLQ